MAKRKLKRGTKIIGSAALLGILAGGGYAVYQNTQKKPEPVTESTGYCEGMVHEFEFIVPKEEYELGDEVIEELRQEYLTDKAINEDLTGILYFQSGLIHQPVFQGYDNDYYLYHDWQTGEYLSWGCAAMDYTSDPAAQKMNTVIYGHYVYPERTPDRTIMFTPLGLLMQEENYEANKYLAYMTEDTIHYYEIALVFDVPLEDHIYIPDGFWYHLTDYEESFWNDFIRNARGRQYYETGVDLTYGDHTLTLQTCIEDLPDNREIVLCKEIARVPLEPAE